MLRIGFTTLLLIFVFVSKAQNTTDVELIKSHVNGSESAAVNSNVRFNKSTNSAKQVSFVLLYFYQRIISEQISAVCEFDMSCSNFGIQAIKQLGFFKGLSLTADRLTRCNGLAQLETENYLINHTTGKAIDEPSMYRFKN